MGMDIPRRGSVFAALCRDKAGGGTRQRKKEAGGTPGGVSPLAIKNQSIFSTEPKIYRYLFFAETFDLFAGHLENGEHGRNKCDTDDGGAEHPPECCRSDDFSALCTCS